MSVGVATFKAPVVTVGVGQSLPLLRWAGCSVAFGSKPHPFQQFRRFEEFRMSGRFMGFNVKAVCDGPYVITSGFELGV